jgi:hypothetical protein
MMYCLCVVAKTIVNMEQSYVTAAFFRHRTAERYKAMMQALQTARLLGEGAHPFLHSTLTPPSDTLEHHHQPAVCIRMQCAG